VGPVAPYNAMNIQRLERILLVIGLTLMAMWCAARLYRTFASRAGIKRFRTEWATRLNQDLATFPNDRAGSEGDFRLWSLKRIEAHRDSLAQEIDAPLAILRIPRIELEVPVFNGTDDLTLDRGVGRILGTERVGQAGNLGIAGHRDGFFRGLKDLKPGDVVELIRPGHLDRYIVSQIRVVQPDDVSVLAPTPKWTLTLVTCFPFYYIGSAPKRYIVTASIQNLDVQNKIAEGVRSQMATPMTKEKKNELN
jgi:sortase A